MKNKKIVILLLVLAAGIWGTIVYRIFNAVDRPETLKVKVIEDKPALLSAHSDTFSIVANYRDPFLGKRAAQLVQKKVEQPVKVKPKPVPVAVVKWPALSYTGIIRNQNTPKELALVKIDQKDFIMKAGDVMQGVELSKIFKDSIVVLYQKEKKVIVR